MMPGRQPQIAVATGQAHSHLAAIVAALPDSIAVYVSTDSARRFSPARAILSGKVMAGRHRGPRAAWIDGALIVTAIRDGSIHSWRSSDLGRSWVKGANVNDAQDSAREGLHALASGNLGLFCTWLDLRQKGTRLYGSTSRDGLSWSDNRLVYSSASGNICECCHPNALITSDSAIHVSWRNWLEGSRDIYLATSTDGGATFKPLKLGQGTWPLNACPMDGGALALPYTAWRREKTVYLCRPRETEIALGEGKDPALAIDAAGNPVIAWTQGSNIMLQLGLSGKPSMLAQGGYAQLSRIHESILAAWETPEESGSLDYALIADRA
ncbi:MAG: sialidase family protein [Acidobacteriota bacterium]